MQKCWNSDSNKRPIANYISDIFEEKIIPNYNNEIEISKSLNVGPIAVINSNKSITLKIVNSARSLEYQSNILESGK